MTSLKGIGALTALLAAAVLGFACGSTPTTSSSCTKTWKVGLVADVGKLSDKSFNFDTFNGVQDPQPDSSLCLHGRATHSRARSHHPKHLGQVLAQNHDIDGT